MLGLPPPLRSSISMTPLLRKLIGTNWVLVLTMYGLLIFGLFAIESAARHLPGGGEAFADMQKRWVLIGSAVYWVVALVDYRWIRWLGIPFYAAGLGLMLVAMGSENEVHQISMFGFTFQPTQVMISAGIVLSASLVQDLGRLHRWLRAPLVKIAAIGVLCGVPFLMVVKIGDMGSALVWVPVAASLLLVSGVPFRYLLLLGSLGATGAAVVYFVLLPMASPRGAQRIDLYLDMLHGKPVDISGDAYAPYYVSMAVGKAGWSGIGHRATAARGSLHDKGWIPKNTAHNDFIFAVISEEQGFRGNLLLLTAYAVLLVTALYAGFYARDMAGRMVVGGVVGLFFAHIFENIGMCVLLTPITGIPLPLISYSGTFVLICMFLLGLVQSVWIHRKPVEEPADESQDQPRTTGKSFAIHSRIPPAT
jgi:rod shape determining protein RodA